MPEQASAADSAAADDPDAQPASLERDLTAAGHAALALVGALRGYCRAMSGLVRGEWRLAQATLPWVAFGVITLVGLGLSLWASVVALIGWGLYSAIGSVGWALLALVGVHIVLALVVRWMLHRLVGNLTMPATRAELASLKERIGGRGESGP